MGRRLIDVLRAKRAQLKHQKAEQAKLENPVDTHLPLDLHIGGRVQLDPVSLLLYSDYLLLDNPGTEHSVVAFSEASIMEQKVFRVHLVDSDHTDDVDNMSQLWIAPGNKKGDSPSLLRLFRQYDEVLPHDVDEWEVWLSKNGHIGNATFTITHETDEGEVDITYNRVWGDERDDWSTPLKFTETFYPDRYESDEAFSVVNECMMYSRQVLPEGSDKPFEEFLFLVVQSTSNDSLDQVVISIDIGVDLKETDFNVIF